MGNRFIGFAGATALALTLAACGTPRPKDIKESENLGANRSIIVGSASRTINTTEIRQDSRPGRVNPQRIVCAEPSPDVATTVAQAITASFQAAGRVDNPQGQAIAVQAAGQFGQSSVQGAIQLGERLTTVTLLRDALHRACEAYANGALSDMSYSLILSRYHSTMVTLLNSELTAGAFGRELGALSGEASHILGGVASDVEAAEKALDTAKSETNTARASLAKSQAELKQLNQAEKKDQPAIENKKKEVDDLTADLKAKQRSEDDARFAAFAAANRGAAARARIEAENVKGIAANVSPEASNNLLELTKMFKESGIPEALLMACITSMDRPAAAGVDGKLSATCEGFFGDLGRNTAELVKAKAGTVGTLEAVRMKHEFNLRQAQVRAGIVREISRLCSGPQTAAERKECIDSVNKVMTAGMQVADLASPDSARASVAVVTSTPASGKAQPGVKQSSVTVSTLPGLPKKQ